MYKILLVDDEPTVRRGMISLINWRAWDTEIVGEASNGAAAIEKVEELKPHMILTDIKMPVMDGIELACKIRARMPSCKIIIMSGYDEFEYAKSLMRINVTEYLLKPVVEEELAAAITRLIGEIEEENAHRSNLQAMHQLMSENLPRLKSDFFRKILSGSFSCFEDATANAKALNISMLPKGSLFRGIAIGIGDSYVKANKDDKQKLDLMKYAIVNIAEEIISKSAAGFLCYDESERIVGLVGYHCAGAGITKSASSEDAVDADKLLSDICRSVMKYLGISVDAAFGSMAYDISRLKASCDEALTTLDNMEYKDKRVFVQLALKYMDENFTSNLRLADVAKIVYVTPNYLSKIFKEEIGMNFVDRLNRLRVDRAKELLLTTNLKTYEVAEQVGYQDHKYFSTIFKKLTGLLPKEFRSKPER